MAKILVVHGPNLNLLGTREPEIYGRTKLDDVNIELQSIAAQSGHQLDTFQSNAEGELINRVQQAQVDAVSFMIVNPGGLTHTSVSLRDAITAVNIPFFEVHLSNIFRREPFRRHSYFSDIASGIISGLGSIGYTLALNAAIEILAANK